MLVFVFDSKMCMNNAGEKFLNNESKRILTGRMPLQQNWQAHLPFFTFITHKGKNYTQVNSPTSLFPIYFSINSNKKSLQTFPNS